MCHRRYESLFRTAIGDVCVNLAPDAMKLVHWNLIGNITTLRLRMETQEKCTVSLTFRYPLIGHCRNHSRFRYDVAHNSKVKVDRILQELKVPVWWSLSGYLWGEELVLTGLLPEWADDVDVHPHASV